MVVLSGKKNVAGVRDLVSPKIGHCCFPRGRKCTRKREKTGNGVLDGSALISRREKLRVSELAHRSVAENEVRETGQKVGAPRSENYSATFIERPRQTSINVKIRSGKYCHFA